MSRYIWLVYTVRVRVQLKLKEERVEAFVETYSLLFKE